jgi:SAM-dependent methyltransferase
MKVSGSAGTAERAFSEKFVSYLNGAAVMLMTSIGHRTGLFDALSDGKARTSGQLAAESGKSERYVREWLAAMATAGVVKFDPDSARYVLPAEHAAFLTRAATPNNLATSAQWVSVLGAVEDEVVAAFEHGRGVPYSSYDRFPEVMAEESQQTTLGGLDEHIIPLVPGLHEKLSAGALVLDLGCGQGEAILHLARRYPRSRFVGVDLLPNQVEAANARAAAEGLGNARFEVHDATTWAPKALFDVIFTFDAIHDQAHPERVLANLAGALKPDGVYVMQDIKASSHVERNLDHPMGPWVYTISCMHCMSVSLAQGGKGLGAAWGRELAVRMLQDAGFGTVDVHELPHDAINYYYVVRN